MYALASWPVSVPRRPEAVNLEASPPPRNESVKRSSVRRETSKEMPSLVPLFTQPAMASKALLVACCSFFSDVITYLRVEVEPVQEWVVGQFELTNSTVQRSIAFPLWPIKNQS